MTPHTPPPQSWREGRRLRAWELKEHGWKQRAIAAALGVSEGAVSQWLRRGREGGVDALRQRSSPGAPRRLSLEQRAQIPALLERGAQAYGFTDPVWTTRRIADVVARAWGVRYHPAHVSRLLRTLRWTPQKPEVRATQRDEEAIATGVAERWPALKKKAAAEQRTLVWVDEAGFYLLPGVVRTYAPCGQTPRLHVRLTRDHLSVIGALTAEGRLLLLTQEEAYTGDAVVGFLRHLLRQIPGKLLVIWDGAPIHRSRAVKAFLAAGAAARLHLERLPGYAPELNPVEVLWHALKHVELRNVCSLHLLHLRRLLRLAVGRLRHKTTVLAGCLTHCGYYL